MIKCLQSRVCFYILLASSLFIYLILRGIHVQMLHDSIATFFRYVIISKFLPYNSEWSANNHFLNSACMWVSYKLLGSSQLALKLPNILTFPVYAFFVYKISGRFRNQYLSWGFILCMLMAHNYFEFFGTARGYGMSMAFLLAGIWFCMQFLQNRSGRAILLTMIFLILSTYANLTIINCFIIITGILLLFIILKGGELRQLFFHTSIIIILGVIPVIFLIILLLKIQAMGELYYGEPDGLFQISIITLSKLLTGSTKLIFPLAGLSYFLLSLILFLYHALSKKTGKGFIGLLFNSEWVFFLLLLGNVVAFNLEHILFGTDFPEDRTGLFFYPLIIGTIFFGLKQINFKRGWYNLLIIFPLAIFPAHFFYEMNISRSSHENHTIPEDFFNKVASDHEPGSYPPTISGYKSRIMRWNYLNFINYPELATISYPAFPSDKADFLIMEFEEAIAYFENYDSIACNPDSRIILLKRKQKAQRELLMKKSNISSDDNYTSEYQGLHIGVADSLQGSSLYLGFKMNFKSKESPFHGWIVASISNSEHEDIFYDFIPLYWIRTDWGKPENTFIGGFLCDKIPDDAETLKIYIWNIGDQEYMVENCEIEIFRLKE